MSRLRRRAVLALPLAATLPPAASAQSIPVESFSEAKHTILAGRTPTASGVGIDMPALSENGNSVDIAVRVDSPCTAEDHVTAIHILSEKNPYPRIASMRLSPRAGRAEVATRIRLATTQTILVLAETSRGVVHAASREVIVVLGACLETG